MSWHDSPLARRWKSMTHVYGWKCKCGEEMAIDAIGTRTPPNCGMCDRLMYMMYHINPEGEIWMNASLLLKEDYE